MKRPSVVGAYSCKPAVHSEKTTLKLNYACSSNMSYITAALVDACNGNLIKYFKLIFNKIFVFKKI